MAWRYLAVAAGGALGAVARYALSGIVQQACRGVFPWGTLAVNLAGCLLIGLLTAVFEATTVSPTARAALLTGGLGAMTTFSTFSLESFRLLEDRQYLPAAGNVIGSCAAGLALVYVGLVAGRAMTAAWR
jgi:CrcB protein